MTSLKSSFNGWRASALWLRGGGRACVLHVDLPPPRGLHSARRSLRLGLGATGCACGWGSGRGTQKGGPSVSQATMSGPAVRLVSSSCEMYRCTSRALGMVRGAAPSCMLQMSWCRATHSPVCVRHRMWSKSKMTFLPPTMTLTLPTPPRQYRSRSSDSRAGNSPHFSSRGSKQSHLGRVCIRRTCRKCPSSSTCSIDSKTIVNHGPCCTATVTCRFPFDRQASMAWLIRSGKNSHVLARGLRVAQATDWRGGAPFDGPPGRLWSSRRIGSVPSVEWLSSFSVAEAVQGRPSMTMMRFAAPMRRSFSRLLWCSGMNGTQLHAVVLKYAHSGVGHTTATVAFSTAGGLGMLAGDGSLWGTPRTVVLMVS
mmetsp:Transcript_71479/g.125768  ORF Transcript_71479/g.125768 Transcript_71479/m.125768 type:complete len:368 (-) Transcript_71479:76-1179(-)